MKFLTNKNLIIIAIIIIVALIYLLKRAKPVESSGNGNTDDPTDPTDPVDPVDPDGEDIRDHIPDSAVQSISDEKESEKPNDSFLEQIESWKTTASYKAHLEF